MSTGVQSLACQWSAMTHLETLYLFLLLFAANVSALITVTDESPDDQNETQDRDLNQSLNNAYSVIDTPPFDTLDHVDWLLDPNDKINVDCPAAEKVLLSLNEHPIATIERTRSGFYKRVINEDFARVTSFDGTNPGPRIVVQVRRSGTLRCFDFKTANNTQSNIILYDNVSMDQYLIVGNERYLIGDGATAILPREKSVDMEFTVTSLLGRECVCESNITTGLTRNTVPLALTRVVKDDHQTIYNVPLWRKDSSAVILIVTCCGGSYGNIPCLQASIQMEDRIISIPASNQTDMNHSLTTNEHSNERDLPSFSPSLPQDDPNNSSCAYCDQNGKFNKSCDALDVCCENETPDVRELLEISKDDYLEVNWIDAVILGTVVGALVLVLAGIAAFATFRCMKVQKKLKEKTDEKDG